ncbi:hypothetical protein [Luteipulveratus flavus]|uniref:Glycosyl transferase family 2 n=1 Tax=Luteipulveratus flavus TaxID=3031728 RepID=A0ABT6CCI7_9MICO|nr:hypothetical protein [Luteipulveratus sp. YIM 133296]MDF8266500.1 hypothetical protein [Luteipulveratus sp. YIM 133296]
MRLNAYVLAADPAWVEESIGSYYDLVDRIVVSYDGNGVSWTGAPIRVEESLQRIRALDVDRKMVEAPGHFARLDHEPLENETHQRLAAAALAGDGADWVLQLDTDEVMTSPAAFLGSLCDADVRGFDALDYPSRLLYQHVRDDLYLEQSRRFWGVAAAYPGPLAVRSGTPMVHCRQTASPTFRVDFRATNTDPAQGRRSPVHRVIGEDEAVMHYSWVRSVPEMRAKSRSSGHARAYQWEQEIARWERRQRRPWSAVGRTPLSGRSGGGRDRLRLVRVSGAPDAAARRRNGLRT